MKNTIVELSQTLYGMEFDEETNTVYYDGEKVARLHNNILVTTNGISYYGDTSTKDLIAVLSLSEPILKDYIESMFGCDYHAIQNFIVSISETLDLHDILEGVTLVENLEEEDIQEIEELEIIDDIVFYDGSNFHEIDDEIVNEFISEIYDELVSFTDTNNVFYAC